MPALKVFGQRLFIAGDDIRVLLILHAFYNAVQVIFAVALLCFALFDNNSQLIQELEETTGCFDEAKNEDRWTYFYSVFSLCLSLFVLFLAVPMYFYSGLGTPTDASPREPLKRLCYFDVIGVNILRVVVFCFGAKQASVVNAYCECISGNIDIDYSLKVAFGSCEQHLGFLTVFVCLFITHCFDVTVSTLSVIYYTCCHDKLTEKADFNNVLSSERQCSLIMRCFIGCTGLFTCGILGGDEAVRGDYTDFALLMTNYLNSNGTLDLTPSDIYVGLYMFALLKKRKKLETTNRLKKEHSIFWKEKLSVSSHRSGSTGSRESSRYEKIDEENVISTISDGNSMEVLGRNHISSLGEERMEMLSDLKPEEKDLVNEAARMMTFAHGAYSIAGYIMMYPFSGFWGLFFLSLRNCTCFSSPPKESIENDNACNQHTIALKEITGLSDDEIVYATYSDTISTIPYMILLDHDWKSVVITIRGTISLESVITDISITPEELTSLGKECGFDGEGLYCHTGMLASTKWIYKELERHGHLERVMASHTGYKLRITGHSLGAGVASILSVLLKPKYPDLRCVALSPPGCVMSENLADQTKSYTTSYVVHDDIIIRLNVENFEELRDGVLEMIYRIKVPKYQVTKVIKKYDDSTVEGLSKAIDEILYEKEDIQNSKFKQQVDEFMKFQDEIKEKHKGHYITLCPPGHIIQLFDTKDVVNESGEKLGLHVARWAERSDFGNIEVSPQCIADHETAGVTRKIHRLATETFGLSPPFSPLSRIEEP